MSAKGQFIVSAYRFRDIANCRGGVSLGKSNKNYTSLETAIKTGIPSLVKNRDGHNLVYIHGPDGKVNHVTV